MSSQLYPKMTWETTNPHEVVGSSRASLPCHTCNHVPGKMTTVSVPNGWVEKQRISTPTCFPIQPFREHLAQCSQAAAHRSSSYRPIGRDIHPWDTPQPGTPAISPGSGIRRSCCSVVIDEASQASDRKLSLLCPTLLVFALS